MKIRFLTALVLLTSISVTIPNAVFSQPKTGANTFSTGFWQPQAQIDPKQPIKITILNQSGFPVNYSLGRSAAGNLPPNGTSSFTAGSINQVQDIVNVNIYSPQILAFDYSTDPQQNQLFVRIRLATNPADEDRSVYIDETGRVYSF
ncbi:hypothetical protein IQ264_00180 [Phormidium sp. LEGE 05292]|uniref:hypothetical protein n=1 Tax=[Phormidium] sp. LEGE 05292 TaxID=767427 RepID=UPI00187F9A66|nr:hypothetical protein [Phormidium sp. LEGE 05292]MBE9223895.1 hypothetical protein [Phormidium sp. LEGE 05292]